MAGEKITISREDLAALVAEEVAKAKGGGINAESLKDAMVAASVASAQATHKALKPENAQAPLVSAYNPLGERDHPRPRLRRPTYFCGFPQKEDTMTAAEIEAFNAFTESREARGGTWKARVIKNGTDEILSIELPARDPDQRMDLPNGLIPILAELREGKEAVEPNALMVEVLRLKAQMAQMEAKAR